MDILLNIIAPFAIIAGLVFSYMIKKKEIAPYFYLAGFTLLAISAFTASNILVAIIWLGAIIFATYLILCKK